MISVKPLSPFDGKALAEFFRVLVERGDDRWFHPHPLTEAEARRIGASSGRDVYAAVFRHEKVLAYGMLRGWDAGFEIPSLGIAVATEFRSTGISRLLMEYLHCMARLRKAPAVRLKVFPENVSAIKLYEALGYKWQPEQEDGQFVGLRTAPKTNVGTIITANPEDIVVASENK